MPRPSTAVGNLCPDTGLTRPECSCPACIRGMLEEFAPTDAKASASRQGFLRPLRHRLPTSPAPSRSVAERLSLPAL